MTVKDIGVLLCMHDVEPSSILKSLHFLTTTKYELLLAFLIFQKKLPRVC